METFGRNPIVGESSSLPSDTIPGEVMTIEEIMQRHVMGLPVPSSVGTYDYEDDGDESWLTDDFAPEDQRDFDLIDALEQQRYHADMLKDPNKDIKDLSVESSDASDDVSEANISSEESDDIKQ